MPCKGLLSGHPSVFEPLGFAKRGRKAGGLEAATHVCLLFLTTGMLQALPKHRPADALVDARQALVRRVVAPTTVDVGACVEIKFGVDGVGRPRFDLHTGGHGTG